MKAHPLFPYFLEKHLAIPTSPLYIYLPVNDFCVTSFRSKTPYLPYIGEQYRGQGGIKMASASTLSGNEPARTSL